MDELDEIALLIKKLSNEPKLKRPVLMASLDEYIKEKGGDGIGEAPDAKLLAKYNLNIDMATVMNIVRLLELMRG